MNYPRVAAVSSWIELFAMPERPIPLCTVMLLDVAVAPGEEQPTRAMLKQYVHGLLGTALRGLPETGRMAVESHSAAVVCFVGDPEEGLDAALAVRDQVEQHYQGKLSVRVALNIGTVHVAMDPHNRIHVTGEGIHHAAEIKERARPNQVVVTHRYHQLLAQINPARAGSFVDHAPGTAQRIKLYAEPPGFDMTDPQQLAPADLAGSVEAWEAQVIEQELASHIGPLAGVLVRKVEPRAASARDLRATLAAAIPDLQVRRAFQAQASLQLQSQPAARVESRDEDTRQLDISPAEFVAIEQTLQHFLGPQARSLIGREIERCDRLTDFVAALAAGIDAPQRRAAFLVALQRALPHRPI